MAKQAVNLGFDKDYLTLNAKSDVLSNMLDRLNVSELKDLNDGIENMCQNIRIYIKLIHVL